MTKREELLEENEAAMFFNPVFDTAIIGIMYKFAEPALAVYSLGTTCTCLLVPKVEASVNDEEGEEDNSPIFAILLDRKVKAVDRRNAIIAKGSPYADKLLFADGYDNAIIGVGAHGLTEDNPLFVLYDYDKVISTLKKTSKMDYEEAVEFFDFNILGAGVGPHTPGYVRLFHN